MSACVDRAGDRSVYERPSSANASRKQSRVLVFGSHNGAPPLECSEVTRKRKRDKRTAFGVSGVSDGPLFKLRKVNDARIFDTPKLFRKTTRVGQECRSSINLPVSYAVTAARNVEMRKTSTIFYACEQKRLAVWQTCRPGVKDGVDQIGPISRC